jgi:hypothetical protein
MTNEYINRGRKQASEKMEAARVLRDGGATKTVRDRAYDEFLFWQDKLAFFANLPSGSGSST